MQHGFLCTKELKITPYLVVSKVTIPECVLYIANFTL